MTRLREGPSTASFFKAHTSQRSHVQYDVCPAVSTLSTHKKTAVCGMRPWRPSLIGDPSWTGGARRATLRQVSARKKGAARGSTSIGDGWRGARGGIELCCHGRIKERAAGTWLPLRSGYYRRAAPNPRYYPDLPPPLLYLYPS